MIIGIFQPNINNHQKLDEKIIKIEKILKFNNDLDVLVLPELFLSYYLSSEEIIKYSLIDINLFKKRLTQISYQYQCSIIFGYPEIVGDIRYNSALVSGLNNDFLYNHRKTFLAPNKMEQSLFSKGNNFEIFSLKQIKSSVLICYEFEFPEIVRKISKLGAQIIFVPTALNKEFIFVANEMLKTRAFESQIVIVYANYCGDNGDQVFCGNSAIVNENGDDLIRLNEEEDFGKIEINFESQKERRKRLPYFADLSKFEA